MVSTAQSGMILICCFVDSNILWHMTPCSAMDMCLLSPSSHSYTLKTEAKCCYPRNKLNGVTSRLKSPPWGSIIGVTRVLFLVGARVGITFVPGFFGTVPILWVLKELYPSVAQNSVRDAKCSTFFLMVKIWHFWHGVRSFLLSRSWRRRLLE